MIAVFLKTLATLLGPLAVGLCVQAVVRSRRTLQHDLEASLSQCRFDTPDGPVTGDALRVVKRSVQVTRTSGNSPSELFW